jgi:hypothetical protein
MRNIMIAQAQSALSNLTGSIKGLAGSHPVVTGIVLGIGAYYAINKYWLNKEEATEAEEVAAAE